MRQEGPCARILCCLSSLQALDCEADCTVAHRVCLLRLLEGPECLQLLLQLLALLLQLLVVPLASSKLHQEVLDVWPCYDLPAQF